MICPVCSTGGQEGERCLQCGADLTVFSLLAQLKPEETPVANSNEKIPNRELDARSNSRRRLWYSICGLAVLTAWLLTARVFFVLGSDVTTKTSASLPGNVIRADGADATFQEILTLTALLKQNMDLVVEQRKEILQLRAILHPEAPLNAPPEAAPLLSSTSNSSQSVRENAGGSSSAEPRSTPMQH